MCYSGVGLLGKISDDPCNFRGKFLVFISGRR